MARKPVLSDSSILGSLFRPSKNPTPAGLRKRTVVKTPGRSAARVRAFNNLSPLKQAMLDKTGQREAYLHGFTTLAKVRTSLRDKAVQLGVAKPLRPRGIVGKLDKARTPYNIQVAYDHVWMVTGKKPRRSSIETAVGELGVNRITSTSKETYIQNAVDPSNIILINGKLRNPWWYL